MNQLVPLTAAGSFPAIVMAAGERAQIRFLEFFAAQIRNANTRRAYGRAVGSFLAGARGGEFTRSGMSGRFTSPATSKL